MTSRRTHLASIRFVRSFAAALVVGFVAVTPVLAHAELVSSDPAAGSTVATPPTTITLTFSENLDKATSSFKLIAPDGSTVGTGGAAKDGDTTMTLDGLALAAGTYTVKWTSGAQDGHIQRDRFAFTVAEATPAPATPAPTDAPSHAATAAPASYPPATAAPATSAPTAVPAEATPAASAVAVTTSSATGGDVLLPIVIGLAIVAIVGIAVLRRSRTA